MTTAAITQDVKVAGDRQPRRGTVAAYVVLLLLMILLGAGLALAIEGPHRWGASAYARDFFKSSGFAGMAALTAALIAYLGIGRQVRVARESLAHERSKFEDSAWWKTFEWVSGEATTAGESHLVLPPGVLIDTLTALKGRTTDSAQLAACVGLLDSLLDRRETPPSRESPSTGVINDDTLRASVQRFISTAPALPRSLTVDAFLYEQEVLSALQRISSNGIKVFPPDAPQTGGLHDAIVQVASGTIVGIEAKLWSEKTPRVLVQQSVERMRRSPRAAQRVLFVSRADFSGLDRDDVGFVRWVGANDDVALRRAIERLGAN